MREWWPLFCRQTGDLFQPLRERGCARPRCQPDNVRSYACRHAPKEYPVRRHTEGRVRKGTPVRNIPFSDLEPGDGGGSTDWEHWSESDV